jgi:hypothetical protein
MLVKLCSDCKWSKAVEGSAWELKCVNPYVNRKDSWALSRLVFAGSDCTAERDKKFFFGECGMRGKLWEQKDDTEKSHSETALASIKVKRVGYRME